MLDDKKGRVEYFLLGATYVSSRFHQNRCVLVEKVTLSVREGKEKVRR